MVPRFAVSAFLFIALTTAHGQTPKVYRTESPSARALTVLSSAYGLRELPDGSLLVNDTRARRFVRLSADLSSTTVLADSIGSTSAKYPQYGIRLLIPYLADSTLFVDNDARVMLVVDPHGTITRAMAHPKQGDFSFFNQPFAGGPGVDSRGRLVYQGGRAATRAARTASDAKSATPMTVDTTFVIAADLDTRMLDTIAPVFVARSSPIQIATDPNGRIRAVARLTPVLPPTDLWTVRSDGVVAVLRAHDYHLELVRADGSHTAGPKMPFAWNRLTDADKRAKLDSVQRVLDSLRLAGSPFGRMIQSRSDATGASRTDTVVPAVQFPTLTEIPDFIPPVRAGAMKADREGRVWILPTSTDDASGGLRYDVADRDGRLAMRVRIPLGRDVVGFGRNGTVYLGWYQQPDRVIIERVRLSSTPER